MLRERNSLLNERDELQDELLHNRQKAERALKSKDDEVAKLRSDMTLSNERLLKAKTDQEAEFTAEKDLIYTAYEKYIKMLYTFCINPAERNRLERQRQRLARRGQALEERMKALLEREANLCSAEKQRCNELNLVNNILNKNIAELKKQNTGLSKQCEESGRQNEELKRQIAELSSKRTFVVPTAIISTCPSDGTPTSTRTVEADQTVIVATTKVSTTSVVNKALHATDNASSSPTKSVERNTKGTEFIQTGKVLLPNQVSHTEKRSARTTISNPPPRNDSANSHHGPQPSDMPPHKQSELRNAAIAKPLEQTASMSGNTDTTRSPKQSNGTHGLEPLTVAQNKAASDAAIEASAETASHQDELTARTSSLPQRPDDHEMQVEQQGELHKTTTMPGIRTVTSAIDYVPVTRNAAKDLTDTTMEDVDMAMPDSDKQVEGKGQQVEAGPLVSFVDKEFDFSFPSPNTNHPAAVQDFKAAGQPKAVNSLQSLPNSETFTKDTTKISQRSQPVEDKLDTSRQGAGSVSSTRLPTPTTAPASTAVPPPPPPPPTLIIPPPPPPSKTDTIDWNAI